MTPAQRSDPVNDRDFEGFMAGLAPFESLPHIAVAVSGGSDSLALTALLHAWSERQGGKLTALTVDHGLRPESAREARGVGAALRRRSIRHRILTWQGPKPTTNIQARARSARYGLLNDWCRRHGVLHLALAHHLQDQAETVLLRLGRGSGLHGLCGMPAVAHTADLRLIRPLLDCSPARLRATLEAAGWDWVDDPSNRNPVFARIRMRKILSDLHAEGITADRLGKTVSHLSRARVALDTAEARLLATAVTVHPFGFAWLDWAQADQSPEEIQLRALSSLLTTLSGANYPPRFERLRRLHGRITRSQGASGQTRATTLGGCIIVPRRNGILIARETRKCPTEPLVPGRILWDGRFEVELRSKSLESAGQLGVGPLGPNGLAQVKAGLGSAGGTGALARYPIQALRALPAVWDRDRLIAAPNLGLWYNQALKGQVTRWRFAPKNPLTQPWFTVA